MAASVDGYIADAEGGVGWLDPFNDVDFGNEQFLKEIRTVVMGRKTYDQVIGFGPGWVYAGKRALVVTSTPLADPPSGVSVWTDGIESLVQHLRGLNDGDVWIVGGAQLQSALIDLGAMERLALFLIPVLLGNGVRLFPESEQVTRLSLDASELFDRGVVRLDYRMR